MEKIELLKPRWKVIADYPGMESHNLKQDDIITRSESAMYADTTQDGNPVVAINHDFFPAIFCELHWSDDREISDMPDYVKPIKAKMYVFKVKYYTNDKVYFINNNGNTCSQPLDTMLPADESEYNDYINSKQP